MVGFGVHWQMIFPFLFYKHSCFWTCCCSPLFRFQILDFGYVLSVQSLEVVKFDWIALHYYIYCYLIAGDDGHQLSFGANMLAAAGAGASTAIATNPLWVVKTRLQVISRFSCFYICGNYFFEVFWPTSTRLLVLVLVVGYCGCFSRFLLH